MANQAPFQYPAKVDESQGRTAGILSEEKRQLLNSSRLAWLVSITIIISGYFGVTNGLLNVTLSNPAMLELGLFTVGLVPYLLFPQAFLVRINHLLERRAEYRLFPRPANGKSKDKNIDSANAYRADHASSYPGLFQDVADMWSKSGQSDKELTVVTTKPGIILNAWNNFWSVWGFNDVDLGIRAYDLEFSSKNYLVIPERLFNECSEQEIKALCAAKIAALQYDHNVEWKSSWGFFTRFAANLVIAGAVTLFFGGIFSTIFGAGATLGSLIGGQVGAQTMGEAALYVVNGMFIGRIAKSANNYMWQAKERQEKIVSDARAVQLGADPAALWSANRKLHALRTGQDPEQEIIDEAARPTALWHFEKAGTAIISGKVFSAAYHVYRGGAEFLAWIANLNNPHPPFSERKANLQRLKAATTGQGQMGSQGAAPAGTQFAAGNQFAPDNNTLAYASNSRVNGPRVFRPATLGFGSA